MEAGIGDRLKHIRSSSRSQPEMATLLGVSGRTYGHWERGERTPDAHALIVLALDGWNANWLLTGEGPERLEALKKGTSAPALDPQALRDAIADTLNIADMTGRDISPEDQASMITRLYMRLTGQLPRTAPAVEAALERASSTVHEEKPDSYK